MVVYEAVTPVNVDSQETYRLHQKACQLVPHLAKVEGIQGFQFAVHSLGQKTFLLLRSQHDMELSGQVKKSYSYSESQRVSFACRLSIAVIDQQTRKSKYFTGPKLKEYLTEKIQRGGIQPSDLSYSTVQMADVNKVGHSFRIPWCDIAFSGHVDNVELLNKAMQTGLGGKKAFGFGLMIERSGAI